LAQANHVVSAERLLDELWGSDAPRSGQNALQYHVSQLRKTLAPHNVIVTQEPGYLIRVRPDELDLLRFERLRETACAADPEEAVNLLRKALALWRGPPLEDLAGEECLQGEIRRLEEVRLATIEQGIDCELTLGRHADVVLELEQLVREHPLREHLCAQLMLALYRSDRQAEALDVYRQLRRLLVDELGIEPSPSLQALEQAILRQDASLAPAPDVLRVERQAIVAVADGGGRLNDLVAIAEPLARRPARELLVARFVRTPDQVTARTAELAVLRSALAASGTIARVAAYVATDPGAEAARFAREHDAELVLADATAEWLDVLLEQAACDVALLFGGPVQGTGPVVTPFGGVEHDWSAIEIAARLAGALSTTLRLLGTEAAPTAGRRDASRLLARASLLVQQVIGIVTEPVLVQAGEDGVIEAARDARLLVIGLSERWRAEGIGDTRLSVAAKAGVPTLFVRHGTHPSGVAPSETMTRFTWTAAHA
jgi:DNA-binding SARP family transcriptional activator